jgi:hypothetical protein
MKLLGGASYAKGELHAFHPEVKLLDSSILSVVLQNKWSAMVNEACLFLTDSLLTLKFDNVPSVSTTT